MHANIKQAWANAVGADLSSLDDWPVDCIVEAINLIDEFDSYRACMSPIIAKRLQAFLTHVNVLVHFHVLDSLED